jgi:hypothetical protein
MAMPVGLVHEMNETITEENRARERAQRKARAKGRR